MLKKVIIIILIILVLLAVVGFIVFKSIFKDQVTMQYDQEVVPDQKRILNFAVYELEEFTKYDSIHALIEDQTIDKIQKDIMDGKFNVVELCQYYLVNIRDNQTYNAVIQLNPEVLEEARLIDERIQSGERLDLFGVTVLIKDNIAAVNMNTSAGAYVLKDVTTTRDAFLVEQIKDKGGIILGKANLSEWSNFMSMPSSNGFSVLGGQTKNAYGKFDVGGSSSGSSVAVALNFSTVTIGTETSGSLIYPAGQNSVVALKPTMGLISRDLIVPISEAQDTAGVEARTVSDLNKVFHSIIAVDSHDHMTEIVSEYHGNVELTLDAFKGKKVGVYHNGTEEMTKIIEEVKSLGAEVVEIDLPDAVNDVDMMSVLNYGIINDVNAFLNNEAVVSDHKAMEDIIEFYNDNKEYAPYGHALLQNALKGQVDVTDIIDRNKSITAQAIDELLKDVDVILSMSNEMSAVYAPCGYPAITVPSGYRSSGEPYGLTLVAGYLQDNQLIEYAYSYEQATQHRKKVK